MWSLNMLLSINEDKVAELVESSNLGYKVSTVEIPATKVDEKSTYPMNYAAASAIYTASTSGTTAAARERLLLARRNIEASGSNLKSEHELLLEISEMRRDR